MRLATCLALMVFLSGCPSTSAARRIEGFASATQLTSENVEAAFEEVEAAHWRRQVDQAVLSWDKKPMSPWSLKPFLSPRESAARLAVVDGLATYAAKLNEVMGNPELEEFDQATKAVGSGLLKVSASDALRIVPGEAGLAVGADDLGPFGTAVHSLGTWLVRRDRAKGVKESVAAMKPHVRTICDALVKDIGSVGSGSVGASGLRAQLARDYHDQVSYRDAWIRTATLTSTQRRSELDDMFDMVRRSQESDADMALVAKTLSSLADAHDRLADAFADDAPVLEDLLTRLVADARQLHDVRRFGRGVEAKK